MEMGGLPGWILMLHINNSWNYYRWVDLLGLHGQ